MPGRGGRGPLPRAVQVSKKIAWLLRHGAEKEGLELGEGGYISVDQVLNNRNLKSLKVTFDELRQIVQENDKQRFTLIHVSSLQPTPPATQQDADADADQDVEVSAAPPSHDPKDYLIRANQGHSLAVSSEGLLAPVTRANAPATAVHGTTHAAWPRIVASGGLRRMARNHVHFASGLPAGFRSVVEEQQQSGESAASPPVISGMRTSSTVLMFLDVRKALDAGLAFGVSDNGVILSEGDENGLIPLELFARVEDRTGQGVLLEEGKVIKDAPLSWAAKGRG